MTSIETPTQRYEIVGSLGRGGWGVVERARDRQLEREVAVKRICDGQQQSEELKQRFLYEAKLTSQLQHPGIVPVHELSRDASGNDYYVMKLLAGTTLRERIRQTHEQFIARAPDPYELRAAYLPLLERFIDICNSVAYAHRQGIIHRDLKPTNVMVGEFGETVVVDWGLGKKLDSGSGHSLEKSGSISASHQSSRDALATHAGEAVGTPAYMSPEQARGESTAIDARTDIFALGVILFEIACGRTPLQGCDADTTLQKVASGRWPHLRQVQPAVPKALAAICEKAMQFAPQDRYQSAEILAEEIRRFIAGNPIDAYPESWPERAARWCRRHQTLTSTGIASGLVLLLCSMAFGVVIQKSHRLENQARQDAEAAHQAAMEALGHAREGSDSWLLEVNDFFHHYPGLEGLRTELLQQAIAQHEELIENQLAFDKTTQGATGGRLEARLEEIRMHLRLCELFRLLDTNRGDGIKGQSAAAKTTATRTAEKYCNSAARKIEQLDDEIGHLLARGLNAPHLVELANRLRIENVFLLITNLADNETSWSKDDCEQALRESAWLESRLPSIQVPMQTRDLSEQALVARENRAYIRLNYLLGKVHADRAAVGSPHGEQALRHFQAASARCLWLVDSWGKYRDLRTLERIHLEWAQRLGSLSRNDAALAVYDRLIAAITAFANRQSNRIDIRLALAHAQQEREAFVRSLEKNVSQGGDVQAALDDQDERQGFALPEQLPIQSESESAPLSAPDR